MTSDPRSTPSEQSSDELRHLIRITERFAELLEDAERRANVVGHLRQELQQARAAVTTAQLQIADLAGRVAGVRDQLTEAERRATELNLERKEYRNLIQRISDSRTVRSATWLADLARLLPNRKRPIWKDMSAVDQYVRERVDRALPEVVTRSSAGEKSVPIWQLPTINATSGVDGVRVGIASMPIRVDGLLRVVDDLYDQAAEIFVYLNDYPEPPSQLAGDERIKLFTGQDLGDRGKFCFVEGFRGYYVTADDDISYPPFYVELLIEGIERYNRKAIVGLHGSIIHDDFVDYYSTSSRKVYSLNHNVWRDQFVHILGTGCSAFHGDTINLSLADFPQPNMADVFLAQKAQREAIPCVVLAHRGNWAPALQVGDGSSIYADSRTGTGSSQDVGQQTSQRVAALIPWKTHRAKSVLVRPAIRVALVGARDDVCRAAFMRDMITPFRVDVRDFDEDAEDLPSRLGTFNPDLVVICLEDMTAETADALVRRCVETGATVVLELRGDRSPAMSQPEIERVLLWRNQFGNGVRLIAEPTRPDQDARLSEMSISLPRPFRVRTRRRAHFQGTEGVLIGDIDNLREGELTLGSLERWISVVREALPDVTIYAFGDSLPSDERTFGVQIIEHKRADRHAVLSQLRLFVSPAAFWVDTLPIEAAATGVPVLFGSDSRVGECLGSGGISVESMSEVTTALPEYYRDPLVWRVQGDAVATAARLSDFRMLAAEYYLKLAELVGK